MAISNNPSECSQNCYTIFPQNHLNGTFKISCIKLCSASNLYESQSNAFALDLLLMRTTLFAARLINEMGLQNKFFQVYYSNTQLSDWKLCRNQISLAQAHGTSSTCYLGIRCWYTTTYKPTNPGTTGSTTLSWNRLSLHIHSHSHLAWFIKQQCSCAAHRHQWQNEITITLLELPRNCLANSRNIVVINAVKC